MLARRHISPADYLLYLHQILSGFRSRHETSISEQRRCDLATLLDWDSRLIVLDLANGWLTPQHTLLQMQGHQVVGIDMVNGRAHGLAELTYHLARVLFKLHLRSTGAMPKTGSLVCGQVGLLPFGDASFDLVSSVAAFEHFLDVDQVIAEIYRTLRPGGAAWIRIHPYTSLSGAHDTWLTRFPLRRLPRGSAPWHHLISAPELDTVPLNRWRIHDYYGSIARNLAIVNHYCAFREGEELLTRQTLSQLEGIADYTLDELTCRAYVFVAQRPPT